MRDTGSPLYPAFMFKGCVSKHDFAPRRGARPIAGGERKRTPGTGKWRKEPRQGRNNSVFRPSGLLCIRINTGESQKALALGSLSGAPPGRLRLTVVLKQSRPLDPTGLSGYSAAWRSMNLLPDAHAPGYFLAPPGRSFFGQVSGLYSSC